MELRHLRYFAAIAEEQSFTRAAERLFVAQPALSTQIRNLESELGIRLLDRHARGVDLTDAGSLFLERARVVIAAAEAARATGDDLRAGLVGCIRLGIASEMGWPLASELLASFGRERPEVEITAHEAYGGTLLRDLRGGRLDAVIAPAIFEPAELLSLSLGAEPWLVLAGPAHRLAGAAGPVAAQEFEGERLVVTGHRDGAAYDRVVAELLREMDVAVALERGGAGPALFAAVAAGDALALTTSPTAALGAMVARPVEPAGRVDFSLFWRDETPASAVRAFIEAASELAEPSRPALRAVA
jgi:DNA-binding transcriptional LysR family regulator